MNYTVCGTTSLQRILAVRAVDHQDGEAGDDDERERSVLLLHQRGEVREVPPRREFPLRSKGHNNVCSPKSNVEHHKYMAQWLCCWTFLKHRPGTAKCITYCFSRLPACQDAIGCAGGENWGRFASGNCSEQIIMVNTRKIWDQSTIQCPDMNKMRNLRIRIAR